MNASSFPYMGFTLSWYFGGAGDHKDSSHLQSGEADAQRLKDIRGVLTVCRKHELLFPEFLIVDGGERIELRGSAVDQVVEQIGQLIASKEISHEIDRIGGHGYVYLPDGESIGQDNLVTIDSIRFSERLLCVRTSVSVWVPIAIDDTYSFAKQVDLARRNGPRLESCLKEISDELHLPATPDVQEVDREYPIWQAGFKLFANPEILEREFRSASASEMEEIRPFFFRE
ncbi:hypothetical protein [Sorangium sp. So ce1099]|uniref:hypothetical protein n=1 Tax=Sorangium sp. So ce1099 TaxID=3133331 RepID=UPI003F61DB41